MGLDDAYIKAVESMTQLDPLHAASMGGVQFSEDRFEIPLFNRIYTLRFPGCEIAEVGTDVRASKMVEVLLMHYLAHADGTAVADRWISYRQLPGAKLFERKFVNLVSRPIQEFFGSNVAGFSNAARALGGRMMENAGGAAFCFSALPKLPLACLLNVGDDEIPSSVKVLFDESAPHYLPTEDLAIMGVIMNSLMIKAAKIDCRKMLS